ncbi:Radical SAM protein [Sulfidibacter corallicola]|uniref:Radical SAM protein n=1 Tax=Sulfidibacter corallicola TaxID=2818388 RepID=A0A8A4TQX0_SULCO|nr:radical SAM protein [Sulfidibacter corallicola]QTD51807.1 radical SAM protein [Sulfidibacter corallicola]
MRTSNYTIYVDLPDDPENVLLVHGYTGAYDRVSKKVANFVRSIESRKPFKPLYGSWSPEPVVDEAQHLDDEHVKVLMKRGYLTSKSEEEEAHFFEKITDNLHHFKSRKMPDYVIMPTYSCNLRCHYCFQDHMRTDPKLKPLLRVMSKAMVDRILGALPEFEQMHGLEPDSGLSRNFILFGGEPLLAESRDSVAYLMARGAEIGPLRVRAISNCTDLHHYRDLLGPGKIDTIQVTLDGPSFEHDKRRIYADGSGSWERIAENIGMALALKVNISARMNVDRDNIYKLPQLAKEFVKYGWVESPHFSSYVAPIHPSNDKTDKKACLNSYKVDLAIKELRTQFEEMKYIGSPSDGLHHQVMSMLAGKHSGPNLKTSFCGAHTSMYVLDAFGDIYTCWERTGDKKHRVGYINADHSLTFEDERLKMWRDRTVVTNPTCKKCRFAFYCGGGCAVLAQNATGNYYTNYCDGFQNRFRATVAEAFVDFKGARDPAKVDAPMCEV